MWKFKNYRSFKNAKNSDHIIWKFFKEESIGDIQCISNMYEIIWLRNKNAKINALTFLRKYSTDTDITIENIYTHYNSLVCKLLFEYNVKVSTIGWENNKIIHKTILATADGLFFRFAN